MCLFPFYTAFPTFFKESLEKLDSGKKEFSVGGFVGICIRKIV